MQEVWGTEQETRYSSNGAKSLYQLTKVFTTSLIIDAHGFIQVLSATVLIYRLNRHADVNYPARSRVELQHLATYISLGFNVL